MQGGSRLREAGQRQGCLSWALPDRERGVRCGWTKSGLMLDRVRPDHVPPDCSISWQRLKIQQMSTCITAPPPPSPP